MSNKIRCGLDSITEKEDVEAWEAKNAYLKGNFDFVELILKEEKIVTNSSMVERVKQLHKEVACEFDIYDENYVKFLLSLNDTQLTQYENFIHKIF